MSKRNLNLCAFPMELNWLYMEANIQLLESSLAEMHPHTDILILPETFSTGFPSPEEIDNVREYVSMGNGHNTLATIKRLAKQYNIAIVGSCIVEEKEGLHNRAFFIEPSGDEYYADKRHLFSMAGEDTIFQPGNKRMKVRFRGWNITLVVCYDLRFPVWCRNKNNEYDLLIVVANWPKARIEAWKKLLYARAIENEAYVAGVNCKGINKNDIIYDSNSLIIDFKGNDIGKPSDSDKFIYASLSLDKLEKFREKFPAWKDADKFMLLD